MQLWINFAKGPLFAFTIMIMILGLARLVVVHAHLIVRSKGRRLRRAPWRKIAVEMAEWAVPVRHLVPGTRLYSAISYLFHIGVLVVALFLADHVGLWERLFNVKLPEIGPGIADILTLLTIACGLVLLGFRIFSRWHRSTSCASDYALLVAVIVPFASGYMAMHPQWDPLPWSVMMLVHLLSADLLFVLVPFTKLSHIVLFFFDRISALHWQLRPGAGDKVAEVLYGEEARV